MTADALAGKRIGLLTASASRLGGGVFEAVVRQAGLLRGLGATPVVLSLCDRYNAEDAARFPEIERHHAAVIGPKFFGYSPQLDRMLDAARLDLLHLHGIWMYPSRAGSAWARRWGKPYLISPHGMLDPWITARGRWKKALARTGYERKGWSRASAFHALTAREGEDIAREAKREDSLIIANPAPDAGLQPDTDRAPVVAYLGRIHPKKNLPALLSAWTELDMAGDLPNGARLIIAGWGERPDVTALEQQLASAPTSIAFIGPCFGPEKTRLLAQARFVVLPSLSEGLPMAILEAWSAGTPCLMSQACNLPQGFDRDAAIDCGTQSAAIAAALRSSLQMEGDAWLHMARAAHQLATGPFSASAIAVQWEEAYAGLMQGTGT